MIDDNKSMKKAEKTNHEKFDLVKGHHITAIANQVKCDHSYVHLIVNGRRPANSALAKKVLIAAQILQDSLQKAKTKTAKALIENEAE